jgi:hypothetical protein
MHGRRASHFGDTKGEYSNYTPRWWRPFLHLWSAGVHEIGYLRLGSGA